MQRELGLHVHATQQLIPGYEVNSLALPYGAYPRENSEFLREGSYGDYSYRHEVVLLVGANPSLSPFHKKFNPARLPRIRASEIKTEGVGLYDWLEHFRQNPSRRYISDGEPHCVTIPESLKDLLDESSTGGKQPRFYGG